MNEKSKEGILLGFIVYMDLLIGIFIRGESTHVGFHFGSSFMLGIFEKSMMELQ